MNQKIVLAIIAVLIIIVGIVYYYGEYNYGASTPGLLGPNQVLIKGFAFNPAVLNVKVGDTVTWTNNDSVAHTISGNDFKSNNLASGQSYSFTFTSAGTFDYICSIHPYMKGAIVVK